MSVLRQISWAAASAITLAASRFLFSAILARRVSPEIFGQYAYGQWIVDVSFLVCSLGVNGAISRYVAEYEHDKPLLTSIVERWRVLAVGLPVVTAGAALLGAKLSGADADGVNFLLLGTWALTAGLWAMQTAALIGMRRFDLVFRANAIVGTTMLVGGFLVVDLEDLSNIFGLMSVACFLGTSVGILDTNRLARGSKRALTRMQWRRIGVYALNGWVATLLSSLVWSRGEFPIIQMSLGDAAMARYAAAFAIFGAAVQGIMLGISGVAPHLTSLWGLGRKEEAIGLARRVMDLQLILAALGTLFMIFFGGQLIQVAFTSKYLDSADLLLILCLGLPGFAVSSQSFLLQLETDARFNRNVIFVGLVLLYALAFSLIPTYGLFGAAIARVSAMTSIGLITLFYAVRYWGGAVASIRNFFSVVFVLLIAVVLSSAVSRDLVLLRGFMMVFGMIASLVLIRDSAGHMSILELYDQLQKRFGSRRDRSNL